MNYSLLCFLSYGVGGFFYYACAKHAHTYYYACATNVSRLVIIFFSKIVSLRFFIMAAVRRYKRRKTSISSSTEDCTINLTDVMDDITWTLTPKTAHGVYWDGKRFLSVKADTRFVLGQKTVPSRVNGHYLFWFVENSLYPVYRTTTGRTVVNTMSRFKTKEEAQRRCLNSLLNVGKMPTNITCHLVLGELIIRAYPTTVKGFAENKKKVNVFKFCKNIRGNGWDSRNSPPIHVI